VLVAAGLVACGQQARPRPQTISEPSFAEQAAAVRAGTSEQIRLDHTHVDDEQLGELAGLQDKLRRINLSRSVISDAGLARLAQMHRLVQLRIASPRITDSGLVELARLRELEHLHLIAPLSDAGLVHLQKLKGLSSLYLDGTEASEAGMAALVEALPGVHLHFDGGHHAGDPRGTDHPH
jgi:hypothetical protein